MQPLGVGVAMRSAKSRTSFWGWVGRQLSWPWWAGLGVILATAVALMGYFLASGGSATYSNHGNCVAQGNGNTVNCPSTDSGPGR